MNSSIIVLVVLYAFIFVSTLENVVRVLGEGAKVSASGKTPLTVKNLITVGAIALAQVLTAWLVVLTYSSVFSVDGVWSVAILFIVAYYLANILAFLTGWGLWSLFTYTERKKIIKEEPNPFTEGQ